MRWENRNHTKDKQKTQTIPNINDGKVFLRWDSCLDLPLLLLASSSNSFMYRVTNNFRCYVYTKIPSEQKVIWIKSAFLCIYLEWSFWRSAESCLGCWFRTWRGQFSGPNEVWPPVSSWLGLLLIAFSKILSWSNPFGCNRVNSKSTWTSSHALAIAQHADCK